MFCIHGIRMSNMAPIKIVLGVGCKVGQIRFRGNPPGQVCVGGVTPMLQIYFICD